MSEFSQTKKGSFPVSVYLLQSITILVGGWSLVTGVQTNVPGKLYFGIVCVIVASIGAVIDHFRRQIRGFHDVLNGLRADSKELRLHIAKNCYRVANVDEGLGIFCDYRGTLHALNAPMHWESLHPNEALDLHTQRLSNPAFERANYYYPILMDPHNKHRAFWAMKIWEFHSKLAARCSTEILDKYRFFVPTAKRRVEHAELHSIFFLAQTPNGVRMIFCPTDDFMIPSGFPKEYYVGLDSSKHEDAIACLSKFRDPKNCREMKHEEFIKFLELEAKATKDGLTRRRS